MFDLFLDKEFDFEFSRVLILDYFKDFEIIDFHEDIFNDAPEWATFVLNSPQCLDVYISEA